MNERSDRTGFTLIEVLVALAIGGMAVSGAAALLNGLGERAEAIERAAINADLESNGERLVRALLANLEPSRDSSPSYVGDATRAAFHSWCETPAGWLDRCDVRLAFEQEHGGALLRLQLSRRDTTLLVLRRGFQVGRLRHLVRVDNHDQWVDKWTHLVAPTAVAVIIDADTLLLPVWGGG